VNVILNAFAGSAFSFRQESEEKTALVYGRAVSRGCLAKGLKSVERVGIARALARRQVWRLRLRSRERIRMLPDDDRTNGPSVLAHRLQPTM